MDIEVENIPRKLEAKFEAMAVCCILGVGQLVAWNTILTISDYYYQVFPEYHPSRVLTLVYQPFVLGTICILVFMGKTNKNQKRITIGYTIFFIGTLLLIILDLVTKGAGDLSVYIVLCSIVACFGIANAHVEGAMVGELSFMCPEFIQSFIAGLGIAGAITSALRLLTKAVFDRSPNGLRKGALLFLAFSTLIEFICIVLYVHIFPKLSLVKYYYAKAESIHREAEEKQTSRLSNKELLYQNRNLAINLFLIYTLTLSIFPGFLYENTGEHKLGSWYPLVLVASYNGWDAFSRYIPLIEHLKLKSEKWITACVLMRFLFVPAFYFTAKNADQGWMISLTSFLGLTNGYLTVCVMAVTPKSNYNVLETNALGNLLVGFMLGGIFAGVCLGWLWLLGTSSSF
ncbi:PREDICTED: equilibrative nucleotide transporter 3-like [Camelina sativa]|uniref:Equilibrative nucleotide transporter 3-like n=1 Tax=Camelina sativa TaxID=90675 RepID=A0ABM0SYW1_CAMSA|nr:PREDICTED: equilibrative nucleotide transporter 3-like [Camelina sativa]